MTHTLLNLLVLSVAFALPAVAQEHVSGALSAREVAYGERLARALGRGTGETYKTDRLTPEIHMLGLVVDLGPDLAIIRAKFESTEVA